MRDLNPRHSPCKGDALPAELITHAIQAAHFTDYGMHVNKYAACNDIQGKISVIYSYA